MAKGKRTPTKIKKLQGSVNVTRDLKDEVSFKPIDGIPEPPSYFGEIARREWYDLLPQLKETGVLEHVDLPQLRLYCYNIQVAELSAEELKGGLKSIITNKGGYSYEVEHPAVKTMNNAIAIINRIASKFGFDPVARTKVAAPKKEPEKDDPFVSALGGMRVAK